MKINTLDKPIKTPELSSEEQNALRIRDVQSLTYGIVGRYSEFFNEPGNRLEFIEQQSAAEFFKLAQFVNSKVRGERFHELRQNSEEVAGGQLPMLHTPSTADKPEAFKAGYSAIKEYIDLSDDDDVEKIRAVAMAAEALIIWVHPFNDGNGRASRFIGNFIEEGGSNPEELARQTASSGARGTLYKVKYISKEQVLKEENDQDWLLSDQQIEEREKRRKNSDSLPDDVEATYLSVRNLLEDKNLQNEIIKKAHHYKKLNRK